MFNMFSGKKSKQAATPPKAPKPEAHGLPANPASKSTTSKAPPQRKSGAARAAQFVAASLQGKSSQSDSESTGMDRLRHPGLNKGTSFDEEERRALGLRGLLPPRVESIETQLKRELQHFRRKPSPIEKYVFLMGLLDRNVELFYRLLVENIKELMPIVYTPTVGRACEDYHLIYTRPRGLYVSLEDLGHVRSIVDNWPEDNVTTVVMTDGGRILGLGDLGANGLGIPVGKLQLYAACAGIPPHQTLPVVLDVGTNNKALLEDELYMGLRRPRERGPDYDALVKEFMAAAQARWGRSLLIQFEDFDNTTAFRLLEETRHDFTTFNDDIQGTAAVTLAGVLASLRVTGAAPGGKRLLREHTFVFLGAGEAGTGIANLIAHAIQAEAAAENGGDSEAMTLEEARRNIWLVDSKGLVTQQRGEAGELQHHKQEFAHPVTDELLARVADTPFAVSDADGRVKSLEQAVRMLRPSAIIGVSAIPSTFTESVCEFMAEINETPLIFALSNPTEKAECTAQQAYQWTETRAIYVSGSPFDPVTMSDASGEQVTRVPGQGNNAYIFPGLGLGVLASRATGVPDELLLASAQALADEVAEDDLAQGSMYPPLARIREVSLSIATRVAEKAYEMGLAAAPRPKDLGSFVRGCMDTPGYSKL